MAAGGTDNLGRVVIDHARGRLQFFPARVVLPAPLERFLGFQAVSACDRKPVLRASGVAGGRRTNDERFDVDVGQQGAHTLELVEAGFGQDGGAGVGVGLHGLYLNPSDQRSGMSRSFHGNLMAGSPSRVNRLA